ncbi:hypothetical protein BR93DRAFT_928674 [Coniochaeta sp. PMI_546]|nr:hypothetical protein BR93DRAFT_928674 [Coniochaeta sp. PMI_546]
MSPCFADWLSLSHGSAAPWNDGVFWNHGANDCTDACVKDDKLDGGCAQYHSVLRLACPNLSKRKRVS